MSKTVKVILGLALGVPLLLCLGLRVVYEATKTEDPRVASRQPKLLEELPTRFAELGKQFDAESRGDCPDWARSESLWGTVDRSMLDELAGKPAAGPTLEGLRSPSLQKLLDAVRSGRAKKAVDLEALNAQLSKLEEEGVIAVVDPVTLTWPKLMQNGTFEPGQVAGTIALVDLRSSGDLVLCKSLIEATNSEKVTLKSLAALGGPVIAQTKLNADLTGQLEQEVSRLYQAMRAGESWADGDPRLATLVDGALKQRHPKK